MADHNQGSTEVPVEEWLPTALATTIVSPSSETHVSVLDDQAILLNLDTGAYHALNQVGTVIWEHFIPDQTLASIHSMLCDRYDVTEGDAREDLVELVTQLYRLGLVHLERQ